MQTRRRFLRQASAAALAATSGSGRRAGAAAPPTLRVAQWTHFVPAFDEWFDKTFAREWGERNGVVVEVDHIAASELRSRAAGEAAARQGHDVFGFLDPPAGYEEHATPLGDVVSECERRFGQLSPLAQRATFNPRNKRHFALADSWAPAALHYRTDWWTDSGLRPDTWETVREGARRIRERHGATAGFGLAPEPDSNGTLRGLLWSFGAAEQDEAGAVTINSPAAVESVKLMAAIYREAMTSDVFLWDPSSNNRMFVWGRASIIENAISAMRSAEHQNPDVARQAALAPPPAGPQARLSAFNVLHCYVVWKWSPRIELAKRFLIDLVAASSEVLQASALYNLPTFARAVPDLGRRLASDRGSPARYALLADAERWSACPGHPGPASAAIEEVVLRGIIPNMFARAARREQTAETSVRQAEAEMKRIFARVGR